jgi:hypothetical protein
MAGTPVGAPRVVYLAGFGRSGSTILERLLGAVPGWTHIGELVDLARSVVVKHERCGCGLFFDECPVWSAVGQQAFGGWDAPEIHRLAELRLVIARQRHVTRLLAARSPRARESEFTRLVREYQDGYARIYQAVADVTGSSVIVDASKGPAHGLALSGASQYRLDMINLVRDPRAVAYSWSRRSIARPQSSGVDEKMWKISALRSAWQWSALQAEVELIRSRADLTSTRLRYEDLVDRPTAAIQAAAADLGMSLGARDLSHIDGRTATLGTSHGLSGNPGRFDTGVIDLQPDTRWRTGLSRREQATVTAVCLPLLAVYGYPVRRTDRQDPRSAS